MVINLIHQGNNYNINSKDVFDISIPVDFNGQQPNFFNVDKSTIKPFKTEDKYWSVSEGASCNVYTISMNIHCSGTHTESVGHLLKNLGDIGNLLKKPFMPAILITVKLKNFGSCDDSYHCEVANDEKIISHDEIVHQYEKYIKYKPEVLVVRTTPNRKTKKYLNYKKDIPPFFSNNAISYIRKMKIKHLIVDIPSVDRASDNGILGNHRIFWNNNNNLKSEINPNSKNTITEMAYIPNSIKDGMYFINLQIPHFKSDAAPSRPLLYKIL
tara:strand:+ start:7654 stop:8463 length:810 start_codon:yes stop_codon:yes gene_type:complete